jgi:hypothetical protein
MAVGAYLEWARARDAEPLPPAPWWTQADAAPGREAPAPTKPRPRW